MQDQNIKSAVINELLRIGCFLLYYLLLIALGVIIVIGSFWGSYHLIIDVLPEVGSGRAIILIIMSVIGLCLLAIMLGIYLIKPLFAFKKNHNETRVEVFETECPDLFAMIRDVAGKTGCKMPKHVYLSPDDYKKALEGKSYKCPLSELSDLVYKYNLQLPTDYMGDASLRRIYLAKNDSELVYVVRLPQMSLDDMSSITTSYLKEYVSSNWSDLYDSMIRLAIVNQMDICFEFNTYSDIEYAKIRMTPEIYNKIE